MFLQYSKYFNIYLFFLFVKFFSHILFTFKAPKCNPWLPYLHGKLRITEELQNGEKEEVFVILGLIPLTQAVHMVEMSLPKSLKLQESFGAE